MRIRRAVKKFEGSDLNPALGKFREVIKRYPSMEDLVVASEEYFEAVKDQLRSRPNALTEGELVFLIGDSRSTDELAGLDEICRNIRDLAGYTLLTRSPGIRETRLIIEYCGNEVEQLARKYASKWPEFSALAGEFQVV
jgi:hypothetical protein